MDDSLRHAIEQALPSHGSVKAARPVAGGCINHALQVACDDGFQCFVKSNLSAPADIFMGEALGLRAMRATNTIRVPDVLATTDGDARGGPPLLILEWIERGSQRTANAGWEAKLGRQLAALHLAAPVESAPPDGAFGFAVDNYLGATPQSNRPTPNWCDFWRCERLAPQLRMARERSLGGSQLQQLGERLLNRLDQWLVGSETPALLHGDLWSGNYFTDADGNPVLIDPACYYGSREAEFGMIRLFGGLGGKFQRAYEEVAPLAAGADERIEIYRLHHLLNHLNLFGTSYLADCLSSLQRLVG